MKSITISIRLQPVALARVIESLQMVGHQPCGLSDSVKTALNRFIQQIDPTAFGREPTAGTLQLISTWTNQNKLKHSSTAGIPQLIQPAPEELHRKPVGLEPPVSPELLALRSMNLGTITNYLKPGDRLMAKNLFTHLTAGSVTLEDNLSLSSDPLVRYLTAATLATSGLLSTDQMQPYREIATQIMDLGDPREHPEETPQQEQPQPQPKEDSPS